MKKKLTIIIPVLVLLLGLGIFFYPTFANYWNSFTQTRAIRSYVEDVEDLTEEEYAQMLDAAREYNRQIAKGGIRWRMTDKEKATYDALLNPGGKGMMAYIEIPKIDVSLGIYHGTNDNVLQRSVGHIEGSSLPVDGESVHCILSGHRGLPSATLFSHLDQITTGDTFMIRTLNEVYTYEVDNINIIEPNDLSTLQVEKGKNLCTLVTCTPYGVNTHRLLVRGHMIETEDSREIMVLAEALQIRSTYVAAVIAVPTLLLIALAAILLKRKPRETDPVKLAEQLNDAADKNEINTKTSNVHINPLRRLAGKEETRHD